MRVAFNLEQLVQPAPGGVGRYTAELARLLPVLPPEDDDAIALAPFVALHGRSRVRAALRAFGLDALDPAVLPLPRPVLYDAWHVLGAPGLGTASRRLRDVDLVHAPSVAVPPRGHAPLIVTAHDAAPLLFPETYPRHGRWFHERGLAAAAERADLVITVSHAAADEIAEHTAIGRDRLRVVPNGVDLTLATEEDVERARRRFDLGDEPYVFWIGSLEPRKNVRLLVDAFARWARTGGGAHLLVLAGPSGWVEDRGAVLAPARDLGARVRTIGRVDDETMLRGLYRGAALFAFPSLHEGFGIPVLEAMAQRTPVLCSDIPALREIATGAARLLPPGDAGAWADAIDELLGDGAALAGLADAGQARAAGFSWWRCAEATRAVYAEALGSRR